jgi:hypothetical protein
MQFFSYIFFQLDEARLYIQDGRPEHLRLALLLLDNCAEMQMAEHIRSEFAHERIMERLHRFCLAVPSHAKIPTPLDEVMSYKPLTVREKRSIDRNFDDKIRYMVERSKSLPDALGGPLQHLHRYRNEAYHRSQVRPRTLRAACLILFELNCEMLLVVQRGTISIPSDVDFSWIKERFGIDHIRSFGSVPCVVDQLRCGVIPEVSDVATVLADYMDDRFADFYGSISEICEYIQKGSGLERGLAEAYEYRESRLSNPDNEIPPPKLERRDLAWFKELESKIPEIRQASTRLDAFRRFAEIERALEPVETAVIEVVVEIDNHIQQQIDIMRGK